MSLIRFNLRNFRRLEEVEVRLEETDTIFVGANNSGKTSATAAFRLFVSQRGDFKIYDFPSTLIPELDHFGEMDTLPDDDYENKIPAIELDLWFTVTSSIYGRVAHLLPSLSEEYKEVGVRIRFALNKPDELLNAYHSLYPKNKVNRQKSLSYYLSQGDNLKRYYGLQYFTLEKSTIATISAELIMHPMDKDDGRKAIDSLLHVDFVEAQRNIDDYEAPRSNRLSTVFASYYRCNLEIQECDNESLRVIEESNTNLTNHYAEQFSPLINVIRALGYPALNDRALRIISNMSAEQALSGNTAVTYVENGTGHELPEAYNGLGYKNLIYIAIQIAHFQFQWAAMGVNRPLCQLVFIEEPEVHLHAQVQQTLIRQIRKVMKEIEGMSGDSSYVQQLVVTTHSSHIIDEVDFKSIRYFRRTKSKYSPEAKMLTASEVINLANFNSKSEEPENLQFLRKYIRLTHCDLFFADAAILVEGTVERLLMPMMINKEADELSTVYMTILELGGAYAHRFVQLLEFINLPTLVITDLDSVDPRNHNSACRADSKDAVTSNASIKEFTKTNIISDLIKLSDNSKTACSGNFQRYITFQQSVPVSGYGNEKAMIPRTFEEAFIYENISKIRDKTIKAVVTLPTSLNYETDYQNIYNTVKSANYKKVEFALSLIEAKEEWVTPGYVTNGLKWLRNILDLAPKSKIKKLIRFLLTNK